VFKEKFGMSFVEYVNRKRLERAVELLTQTTISVDEISTRVGYTNRGHFYRVFSKYIGGQPSDYRNEIKK
jgi:two-component system response regulator YesN